ncbi:hypothetical protein NKOR_00625 [Candidatus Nitrosopumilus koreensis AR1]|uniref:Uncharacterized protein n=1 Tax=Candidatus Nitrosopumilus koreensis AR1 TaxID=1229908 RepID=K0B206_9ARCH|nr:MULTISPECIES: hypothetical protein [Nitrosopumilus]AFS80043.1 hypothetical protein NKOR_00625 [Candidatus Nitrosopumilus koreensis AR1]
METSFFDKLKPYKPEQYSSNITLDKLVTVGLLKLDEAKIEKSFDNVVVILHKLFPEKFSLITYPQYPDSIRVDNTLRLDAKKHSKYLTGNRVQGYELTSLGKITAEDTLVQLSSSNSRIVNKISGTQRNRATRAIGGVSNSDAFKKYSTKQFKEINRFDVCSFLHGTLETDNEKLLANLKVLKRFAKDIGTLKEFEDISKQTLEFFDYIEKNWEEYSHD